MTRGRRWLVHGSCHAVFVLRKIWTVPPFLPFPTAQNNPSLWITHHNTIYFFSFSLLLEPPLFSQLRSSCGCCSCFPSSSSSSQPGKLCTSILFSLFSYSVVLVFAKHILSILLYFFWKHHVRTSSIHEIICRTLFDPKLHTTELVNCLLPNTRAIRLYNRTAPSIGSFNKSKSSNAP